MYTIKSLNLTERGFAILAQFPEEALQYADSILGGVGGVKDPFGYFVGVARRYCTDKGLQTDYGRTVRLIAAYQIPNDMPHLLNSEINRPSTKSASPSSRPVGYDLDAIKNRIQQRTADYVDQLKQTDPEAYARHMGRVETMQNILGIDSEGNTLDQSNPPSASKFVDGLSYIKSGEFTHFKEKESNNSIEKEYVRTPQTPFDTLDDDYNKILEWWKNTHMGTFKTSSLYSRLDHQLKTQPTKQLMQTIKSLMNNWPPHASTENENQR